MTDTDRRTATIDFDAEDVRALEMVEQWLEATFDRRVVRRYDALIRRMRKALPPR